MVDVIRKEIEAQYSKKASDNITVLYGGSVNLTNFKKILTNELLDGVLIGGACLDVDNFAMMARETY